MALLLLKEVAYHAGGKLILDRLDLSIEEREVQAILGSNGTGKSTLAYLIMGCEGYRASSGDIIFDGSSIASLGIYERARLGITMAWQEPVRFEGIPVRTYLTLNRKDSDPARCLEMVGLAPERYLERMADKSLSGGERKRIELASILALKPRLAILDEPDSGIDMLSTGDIINVVNTLRENGAAVLLITHREEISRIADKACLLCGGRVMCSGTPGAVSEYYKSMKCQVCPGGVCIDVRA